MVQVGREPAHFKPLPAVGPGAYEIRVQDEAAGLLCNLRGKVRACGLRTARLPEEDTEDPAGGHRTRGEALQTDRRGTMKKANTRITRGSGNVFLDLGFPPHEAAVMLLRCELAEALRQWMARESLTQAQAAKRLGVAQPRISEIARNKVDKLSLDYLVGLCAKAGVSVAVKLAA
jgi:predicted XRE-type DNA-binding protein